MSELWIRSARLKNFSCYRGTFELEFAPIVYAVIARLDGDGERSNWLGKSSFLHAFVWALTGDTPEDVKVQTELICRGEKECEVAITLSDGTRVERSLRRGQSAVLKVWCIDGEREVELIQDGAQKWIDEHVINLAHKYNTNFVLQKSADRLMKTTGASFASMIVKWFGLERVVEACDTAEAELNELGKREAEIRKKLASAPQVRAESDIECEIEAQAKRQAELTKELDALVSKLAEHREWEGLKDDAAKYERAKAKLADLVRVDDVSDERLKEANAEERKRSLEADRLEGELKSLEVLSRGEFDGVCPVAKIDCPARATINADFVTNARRFKVASVQVRKASEARASAEEEADKLARQAKRARAYERDRGLLEQELKTLEPRWKAFKAWVEPVDVEAKRQSLTEERDEVVGELQALRSELETLKSWTHEKAELEEELKCVVADIRPWREACQILGPEGAQRVVAERFLRAIVEPARESLREVGTGLALEVEFERESQKLARVCRDCGNVFPPSQRVKTCERCGATRGNAQRFFPRLVLNRVSGGSKDMGGFVFQCAASRWLRESYGIPFATLFADEPFRSLDRANSRGLGVRIMSLIGKRYGFAQAFIIEHNDDVSAAAPGRIVIESDGRNSRVRVG